MDNSQEIALKIKTIAQSKGILIKKMFSDLNMNVNTISLMSKGREISYVKFAKVADYLDVSVDYLLGRTNNPDLFINISDNNNNNISIKSDKIDDTNEQFFTLFKSLSLENKVKLISSAMQLKKEESK